MIQINYGIMESYLGYWFYHRKTSHKFLNLPEKFINLLKHFSISTKRDKLEFSDAYDDEDHIWAISIVHPKDIFNRKIGRNIVDGRVLRMKGLIPNRKPYYPIPEWIYLEEIVLKKREEDGVIDGFR